MKLFNPLFLIKLALFQLVCIFFSVNLGIHLGSTLQFSKYQHVFLKNISIAGVNVEGQTPTKAIDLIETNYLNDLLKQDLTVNFEDNHFKLSLATLFEGSDLSQVVSDAFNTQSHLTTIEKYRLLRNETSRHFMIKPTFNEVGVNLFVESITSSMNQPAIDAKLTIGIDGSIQITPSQNGFMVDELHLRQAIENCLTTLDDFSISSESIGELQLPKQTENDLSPIDTLISTSMTTFTLDSGKATNIKLAAEGINGIVLMPDETFSFNAHLGDTTLEKGYQAGPTFINGKLSTSIGGGVCQVSSTLYNAIMGSGLNYIQRQPHSKPVAYLPLGQDAAISWDTLDYQFKNTLDYPLYIQAYTEGNKLFVKIYSNKALSHKSYQLKSETLETLPFSTEFVKDPSLPSGSKQLIQAGSKGYKVKVTREIYENNSLLDVEEISIDTYKPTNTIYKVNF